MGELQRLNEELLVLRRGNVDSQNKADRLAADLGDAQAGAQQLQDECRARVCVMQSSLNNPCGLHCLPSIDAAAGRVD